MGSVRLFKETGTKTPRWHPPLSQKSSRLSPQLRRNPKLGRCALRAQSVSGTERWDQSHTTAVYRQWPKSHYIWVYASNSLVLLLNNELVFHPNPHNNLPRVLSSGKDIPQFRLCPQWLRRLVGTWGTVKANSHKSAQPGTSWKHSGYFFFNHGINCFIVKKSCIILY